MMIGRGLNLYGERKDPATIKDEVALRCENFSHGKFYQDVNIQVKKGEILGMYGLVGAGRTEFVRGVFGADKTDSGKVYVYGKEVKIDHPRKAIKAGIGLVTENRREEGLMLNGSLKWNISMTNLEAIMGFANCLSPKKEKAYAEKGMQIFRVKATGYDMLAGGLSGGNQQKVVLAKWLMSDPKVLILDEPTRGVDVGAKSEIHSLICEFAKRGLAVIMISSELPEVMGMSDRILVYHEGRINGEVMRADILGGKENQETILAREFGN
jgi:ribose transport system ATP-binding protein/inositol transport system ATP-binding protein